MTPSTEPHHHKARAVLHKGGEFLVKSVHQAWVESRT